MQVASFVRSSPIIRIPVLQFERRSGGKDVNRRGTIEQGEGRESAGKHYRRQRTQNREYRYGSRRYRRLYQMESNVRCGT